MKKGLNNFLLPTIFPDEVELVIAEYGSTACAVYIKLLQKIHGEAGYFTAWNDDIALLFAKRTMNEERADLIKECVLAFVRRGVFDADMLKNYGILTSREIQETYLYGSKRWKNIEINQDYLLVDCASIPQNVYISSENVYTNSENVYTFQTSKIKESKVNRNECKVKGKRAREAPRTPGAYYGTNKNVWLTEEQLTRIKELIPEWQDYLDKFSDKLKIYNYKPEDHFKVLCSWWEKDKATFNGGRIKGGFYSESFDEDAFFEAALKSALKRNELSMKEDKKKND